MKISLQEKIAELEARISDLENEAALHTGFAPRMYYRNGATIKSFGEHWHKMWKEFDLAMKEFFS